MEKHTILAIALSSLVMVGWLLVQPKLFPPEQAQETEQASGTAPSAAGTPVPAVSAVQPADGSAAGTADEAAAGTGELAAPAVPAGTDTSAAAPDASANAAAEAGAVSGDGETAAGSAAPAIAEERVIVETELVRAVLTNQGGDMISYRLKKHSDKGDMVEMILSAGDTESHAFTLAFGGLDARPVDSFFRVSRPSPLSVEFARDFSVTGYPGTITLIKRYDFEADEYLFRLTVSLDSASTIPLNVNNAAYTLAFGPQIGPGFQKLDQRYEYRHYYTMVNGKRKTEKVGEGNPSIIGTRVTWAAIAGKYFTVIAVPDNTLYEVAFSAKPEPGLAAASRLYMVRPALDSARTNDVFHFYLGPKNQENLGRYDTGDNKFKLRELNFTKAASTSGILSPLESLLKLLLQFFYNLVPNYGVAIILLTLLVKIILFPLTKKSSEASIKMQALAPKIKELQEKYRENPAKLNAEMGALYKREGHNPMSGCLPLLIQMPILFAMYNLFNTHFDLRGALFLPGWIPDLSLPESVYNFQTPLPLLGWESIRLLPFIYVGSQMLYGLATRTPEQQGNPSMKMMMYVMPVMFFFILYNVPSGLLVFWIMSNVFTLIQQVILNKYLAAKRQAAVADEGPPPVIAPPRRKKRR